MSSTKATSAHLPAQWRLDWLRHSFTLSSDDISRLAIG